ncbi:lasso peptide biosynthesis B2 protein [Gordonia sp. PDNC005]|nr:lasso peptide biosynthesis B2 protein [Gordonia sp. PDNC005]
MYTRFIVAVADLVSRRSFRVQKAFLSVLRTVHRVNPMGLSSAEEFRWLADCRENLCVLDPRCAAVQGCLTRSLSIAIAATFRGVNFAWVTGFSPSPFYGHAWIEHDGSPVGESLDVGEFNRVAVVKFA